MGAPRIGRIVSLARIRPFRAPNGKRAIPRARRVRAGCQGRGMPWPRPSSRNVSSSSRCTGTTDSSSVCASRRSSSGRSASPWRRSVSWGSVLLWGISATVGLLQNFIYSESAAMFPDKPGGIALYAHEGWRSRFSLFGPIAAFGYWIGWSVVLSFVGNIVGALIVAEWFPKSGDGVGDAYFNLGFADFGLAQLIAVFVILARLVVQRPRGETVPLGGVHDRRAADGPAVHLHRDAVLHRGLVERQPGVRPQRRRPVSGLQRPLGRADVAVHHVLVRLRDRGLRRASHRSITTRSATRPRPSRASPRSRCSSTSSFRSAWAASSDRPATTAASTSRR